MRVDVAITRPGVKEFIAALLDELSIDETAKGLFKNAVGRIFPQVVSVFVIPWVPD